MTQCIYLRFLYAKNRCAQGFQSLPHAGNKRFRKCGEKPRSVDQTAVLHLCPAVLLVIIGLRSEVSDFPVLPKTAIKTHCPKAKTRQIPFGNSPLNAKTAFRRFLRTKPDVPSQGLFTVGTLKENPGPSIQCHEASRSVFEPHESVINQGGHIGTQVAVKTDTGPLPY